MAQGIFGGATSYEEQSLQDILQDINAWVDYTVNKKQYILEQQKLLQQSGFWDKIAFNFQATIITTISYFDTVIFDLNIVKAAIENSCIKEKEIKLLKNIGKKAREYNREYGETYKEDLRFWCDYGNPDFIVAEQVYGRGRDYFVTMQDAGNAAAKTIEMVKMNGEPVKIKKALTIIKELAVQVSSSLIASGICGLIIQLPIW